MGSAQSIVTENAGTVAAAVGAVALVGAASLAKPSTSTQNTPSSSQSETKNPETSEGEGEKGGKKKKKKQSTGGSTTTGVVSLPSAVAIPGQFEDASAVSDTPSTNEDKKKAKKKKSKPSLPSSEEPGATPVGNVVQPPPVVPAPEPSTSSTAAPSSKKAKKKSKAKKPAAPTSTQPVTLEQSSMFTDRDTDAEWTRVESKKNKKAVARAATPTASTSTGGDETESSAKEEKDEEKKVVDTPPKPLAERLLPKPRKTGVEDMLETPDHPTLARVMRVIPAAEKPTSQGLAVPVEEDHDHGPSGTSGAEPSTTTDDDGWGFVPVKSRKKPTGSLSAQSSAATTEQTKKQRQNAAKRANAKAAKEAAERERLDLAAKHKRVLERERMKEQTSKAGSKELSGGQAATIDMNGKLVWE